jgi:hypothetical protein
MRRLDGVLSGYHGEPLSAIAAAQSASVVVSLEYAKGWGRTSDTTTELEIRASPPGIGDRSSR